MQILRSKLFELIQFASELDDLGQFSNGSSFLSIAFGTLRKDIALSKDIYVLSGSDSSGLGSVALCRILAEDYLHLSYIQNNPSKHTSLFGAFNTHPAVDGYLLTLGMQDWGIEPTKDELVTLAKAKIGFEKYKKDFLRFESESKKFNPDDYYRNWTKENLSSLIRNSGITDESANELRNLKKFYDVGSSVIHHNAFLIWNLSRIDLSLVASAFPNMSLAMAVSTFVKVIKICLEVKYQDDDDRHLEKLNELERIL